MSKFKYLSVVFALAVSFLTLGMFSIKTYAAEESAVKAECNLSLGEDIVLNTVLSEIPNGYTAANAKFVLGGREQSFGATVENGKVSFGYTGITPNYFSSTVDIEYTLKGNGVSDMSIVKSFSVDDYVKDVLGKYPSDTALKRLVADMYAYGEALKIYAGAGNTALQNLSAYDLTASAFSVIENPGIKKISGTSNKLTWVSAALYFDYKVNVAFTFTGNFTNKPTLKVEKNGIEETIDGLVKEENGGKTTYTGIYRSLSLTEYATEIKATVYDGEEKIEKTASYSVSSGVFAFMNDTDETYKNCVRSVYNYCLSAMEYSNPAIKSYTLKITDGTGVSGQYRLTAGSRLPAEAIDENAVGYYNVDDVTEFGNIEDFVMPDKDYNLAFYYKDETTAQKLLPGSFKTGDYKTDDNVTTKAANAIVDGKLGTLMTITGKSGDYFRFVTQAGTEATALGIQAGRTYRFDYTFVNYGTGEISFKVIGVQTKDLMTEENGAVISEAITLKAGEKKKHSMTITLKNDNANAMTCISLLSAFNESKLGVYMTKTNADAAEHMHTLTLDSTVNATFADGKKSISLEWGSEMPEVVFADINFEYGGWYDVKDLSKSFVKGKFVMPDGDITVATLKSAVGVALDFGFKTDNIKNLTYDGSSRKDGVVGGYKGREVTIKPTAKGSGTIRFQSAFGSSKTVGGMTFVYTIENRGKTKVKFTLNQVNSGTNVLAGASANVELEAGETKTYTITMPDIGGTNANALSYMQFTFEDTTDVVLGIALSYTEKE